MTIELSPEQEKRVQGLIEAGQYESVDAFINKSLEAAYSEQAWIKQVQAGVAEGLADLEAGRYTRIASEEDEKAFMEKIKERGRERFKQENKPAH